MTAFRLLIVMLVIPRVYSEQLSLVDSNAYGPYKVWWRYYELCSGPKRENLTHISKSLLVENDVYKGVMNFSFAASTRIDEIKINVIANKNSNTKNILWNYKVDKPCQHYAIAWILAKHLGASNCVVKKGEYYTIVDFTDATYKFFGNSFFYGDYIFKLLVLSKKGNIACVLFNPVFTKAV